MSLLHARKQGKTLIKINLILLPYFINIFWNHYTPSVDKNAVINIVLRKTSIFREHLKKFI